MHARVSLSGAMHFVVPGASRTPTHPAHPGATHQDVAAVDDDGLVQDKAPGGEVDHAALGVAVGGGHRGLDGGSVHRHPVAHGTIGGHVVGGGGGSGDGGAICGSGGWGREG